MSDLISRQAVIDAIHNYWGTMIVAVPTETTKCGIAYDMKQLDEILEHNKKLVGLIKEIPYEADPIRRGRWKLSEFQNETENANGNYRFECTCCKHLDIHARGVVVPYCWWCGARMEGSDETD